MSKEYHRKYRQENKDRIREVSREKIRKRRLDVIEKFGGKCVYCGCDIPEALEINHIYGKKDIHKHHKTMMPSFIYAILRGEYDGQIELTCKVCNSVHYLEKLRKLDGKWTVVFKHV